MTKKYYRKFFTLTQKSGGFGKDGKSPSGRCTIETVGETAKITVYAQDVLPAIKFRFTLGCDEGSVFVGNLFSDAKGKIDAKFTVNADNAADSDLPIDRFTAAGIIAGNSVVLSDGEINSATQTVRERRALPLPEPPEPKQEPTEPLREFIEPTPPPDVTGAHGAPLPEAPEPPRESEAAPPPDVGGALKGMIDRFNAEMTELSKFAFMSVASGTDVSAVEKLFLYNTRLYPFETLSDDSVWVKISPADLARLPFEQAADTAEFAKKAYDDYEHLVLGRVRTETEGGVVDGFVLAVPDVYGENSPEGFSRFKTCSGEEAAAGARGYWLLGLTEKA